MTFVPCPDNPLGLPVERESPVFFGATKLYTAPLIETEKTGKYQFKCKLHGYNLLIQKLSNLRLQTHLS